MRSGMICLWIVFGVVVITASCQEGDWRDVSLKMDQLETDLRHDGLITVKRPDVWTENRLHTYRSEFEDAFRPRGEVPFKDFEPNINAKSSQVQLERLGLAADIAIAMAGGGSGGRQSGPNLADFLASSLMTNFNTATSLTEQDFFGMLQKGVQGFLQQSSGINPTTLAIGQNDQIGNAVSGSGTTTTPPPPSNSTQVTNNINPAPTPRPTSRPAFDFLLGAGAIPEILKLPETPKIELLSPFEEQAQKRAFVQQNHLFRIGNEPDDGTRMKGYRLYYMRFMVSVTPSSATQEKYSAEILLSPTYDVLTASRDWVAQYAKAMLHDRLIRTAEVALEIKLRKELLRLSKATAINDDPETSDIVQSAIRNVPSRLWERDGDNGGPDISDSLAECKRCVAKLEAKRAISSCAARSIQSDIEFVEDWLKNRPEADKAKAVDKLRNITAKIKTLNQRMFDVAALVGCIRTQSLLTRTMAKIAYREYANEIDYLLGVPNSVRSKAIDQSKKALRVLRAEAALKAARGRCGYKPDEDGNALHDHGQDCVDRLLGDALNLEVSFNLREIIYDAMKQLKVIADRSYKWRPGNPNGLLRNNQDRPFYLNEELPRVPYLRETPVSTLSEDQRTALYEWRMKEDRSEGQAEAWVKAYEIGLKALAKSDSRVREQVGEEVEKSLPKDLSDRKAVADHITSQVTARLMRMAPRPVDIAIGRKTLKHYFSQMEWPIYTFAVAPFSEVENISRAVALNSELQILLNVGLKAGGTLDAETALEYSRQLREQYQAIQVNRTVVGIVRGEQHFGWQINPPFSLPVSRSWTPFFGDRLVFDEASGKKMPSRTHEVFALVAIPGFLRNLNFGVSTEWTCDNRSDGARIGIGKSASYLRRYQWIKQNLDPLPPAGGILDAVALHNAEDNGDAIADVFIKDRLTDRLSLVEASLPLRRMHNVLLPYGDVAERMTNTSGIDLLTPKIYSIQPVYLPSHHKIKLVITGKNFDTGRVQVLVSGVEADVVRIANDHTLIAEMSARRFMGNLAAFNKRTLPDTTDNKRLHELEGLATVTVITPVGAASDFTMIRLTAKEVKEQGEKKTPGPAPTATLKTNVICLDINNTAFKDLVDRKLRIELSKAVKATHATVILKHPTGKIRTQFEVIVSGKKVTSIEDFSLSKAFPHNIDKLKDKTIEDISLIFLDGERYGPIKVNGKLKIIAKIDLEANLKPKPTIIKVDGQKLDRKSFVIDFSCQVSFTSAKCLLTPTKPAGMAFTNTPLEIPLNSFTGKALKVSLDKRTSPVVGWFGEAQKNDVEIKIQLTNLLPQDGTKIPTPLGVKGVLKLVKK